MNASWLNNEQGVVAIEFSFVSLVLASLVVFLADLVLKQATIGKLDRVAYSVAGVLRERTQFYGGQNELTQDQANQLAHLAENILHNMSQSADLSGFSMTIESLLDTTHHSVGTTNGPACQPYQTLDQLGGLAPQKPRHSQQLHLYQVTLCLPTVSWFSRLINQGDTHPQMKSSAVVVRR